MYLFGIRYHAGIHVEFNIDSTTGKSVFSGGSYLRTFKFQPILLGMTMKSEAEVPDSIHRKIDGCGFLKLVHTSLRWSNFWEHAPLSVSIPTFFFLNEIEFFVYVCLDIRSHVHLSSNGNLVYLTSWQLLYLSRAVVPERPQLILFWAGAIQKKTLAYLKDPFSVCTLPYSNCSQCPRTRRHSASDRADSNRPN